MKTIHNPVTGKNYKVAEHSGKYKGPGKIKGSWRSKNGKK